MVAVQRADTLFARGDVEGQVVWKRTLKTVVALMRTKCRDGDAMNWAPYLAITPGGGPNSCRLPSRAPGGKIIFSSGNIWAVRGAMAAGRHTIRVNRAPVLTLWAAVVAERLGFDRDEALTLGRAVAGLDAHAKGVRLGLFRPAPKEVKEKKRKLKEGETLRIDLLGRAVPAVHTPAGLRAASKERRIAPASVERYLDGKFGETLPTVRKAMETLARSMPAETLAAEAFKPYEQFRREVPAGVRGWGVNGRLDMGRVLALAH